jgi:hypothetical protein
MEKPRIEITSLLRTITFLNGSWLVALRWETNRFSLLLCNGEC